jgi:hypothetical protein
VPRDEIPIMPTIASDLFGMFFIARESLLYANGVLRCIAFDYGNTRLEFK